MHQLSGAAHSGYEGRSSLDSRELVRALRFRHCPESASATKFQEFPSKGKCRMPSDAIGGVRVKGPVILHQIGSQRCHERKPRQAYIAATPRNACFASAICGTLYPPYKAMVLGASATFPDQPSSHLPRLCINSSKTPHNTASAHGETTISRSPSTAGAYRT